MNLTRISQLTGTIITAIVASSCSRAPINTINSNASTTPKTETASPVQLPLSGSNTILPKAPPPLKNRIGGCRAECRTADQAFSSFLQATADGKVEAITRLLDTTVLAINNEALGARWVEMFQKGEIDQRAEDVTRTAEGLTEWTKGLPREVIQSALDRGHNTLLDWSTKAEMSFDVPGQAPIMVELKPRGIEWLITRIDRPQ